MRKFLVFMMMTAAIFAGDVQAQSVEELQGQIILLQELIEELVAEGLSEEEATLVAQNQLHSTSTTVKAQLFAGLDVSHYLGHFGYVVGGNWKYGQFSLNQNRQITKVAVQDEMGSWVVLHDDPHNTLSALPVDQAGYMVNYHVSLEAYSGDKYVAYGSNRYDCLEAGQPIRVELVLANQERFIPFALPGGVNSRDLAVQIGGYTVGWYDEDRGGFRLWFDLNLGLVEYQIVNLQSGEVLQVGTLDPTGDHEVNTGQALNVVYDDGIEVLDFAEKSYFNLPKRNFPGQDLLAGQVVPSKAVIIKREDESDRLYLRIDDFVGQVALYWVHSDGSLLEAELEVDDYNYFINSGPKKALLVFYGHEDPDGQFSLYLGQTGLG